MFRDQATSITIRIPSKMLLALRDFASRYGVGYQSLIKRWLGERIAHETSKIPFPFPTSAEEVLHLETIVAAMEIAGVDNEFIVAASDLARADQGVYDLMAIWLASTGDPAEQDDAIADIRGLLRDYRNAVLTTDVATDDDDSICTGSPQERPRGRQAPRRPPS